MDLVTMNWLADATAPENREQLWWTLQLLLVIGLVILAVWARRRRQK